MLFAVFYSCFTGRLSFNSDIGSWDVSKVTTMQQSKCLPSLAAVFTCLILYSDLASCVRLACGVCGSFVVFRINNVFNQDIGSWDVSKVTTMSLSKCLPSLAAVFTCLIFYPNLASFFCLFVSFALFVACVGLAQCSAMRVRSIRTLTAGTCRP